MKLLIIVAISMSLMACSFSKDKNKDNNATAQTHEDVDALLLTNFERLVVAIRRNDSKEFYSVLKKATLAELNQQNSIGMSLLEICVENDRFDFYRDLLAGGASPFIRTTHPLGDVVYKKPEYKMYYIKAQESFLLRASAVCQENNVDNTLHFLMETKTRGGLRVCGRFDLYEYHFSLGQPLSEPDLKKVAEYAIVKREQMGELGSALASALVNENETALSFLESRLPTIQNDVAIDKLIGFLKDASLSNVLKFYKFFESRNLRLREYSPYGAIIDSDFRKLGYNSNYRPSPPPPLKGGAGQSGDEAESEGQTSFEGEAFRTSENQAQSDAEKDYSWLEAIRLVVRYRMDSLLELQSRTQEEESFLLEYKSVLELNQVNTVAGGNK